MLIDEGGRYQTIRTDEDCLEIFKHEFESLQPLEREVALAAFSDYLQSGKSPIIELASQAIYKTPPVTMDQFLSDSYFLGSICKTLFPKVKEELCEIFSGQYNRAIIGGALGLGKTLQGVIGILRMVYEASCLWNPHETYGVGSSDFIMFPCISSTEDVAERNILEKIRSIVDDSLYFNQEFKPEKNSITHGIVFPNKILIPPGASTMAQLLGGNAIGCFLDEANWFPKRTFHGRSGEMKENIEMIYEAIKRRMESRFTKRGKLPGIIIIASSKATTHSFTERIIQQSIHDPRLYVSERAVYEVHPPERYSGKKFRVALGNETKMSRILVEGEPDPEAMKVIEVPIEFYGAFENDIEASIRDFSGYSTVAITPFIARREKIYECIDKTRVHPFNQETWDQDIQGIIQWDKLCKMRKDGSWEPIVYPSAPRNIHLDLSKNQCATGFCVSCVSGYVPVQRFGKDEQEMAPVIHVDFILQIRAPMAGEIIYAEIRKLIYEFSQHGFFIKLVSADMFQSLNLLQTMKSQGYNTKVVSVEPAGGPYEILKTALYENRIQMYHYPPLIKELRELQKNWKNGKVDHPETKGGSKDISDALASVVATLTQGHQMVMDQPISKGIEVSMSNNDNDDWLNEGHIVVNTEGVNDPRPEWRRQGEQVAAEAANVQVPWRENAQKMLDENPGAPSYQDWRKNFQMPFSMG